MLIESVWVKIIYSVHTQTTVTQEIQHLKTKTGCDITKGRYANFGSSLTIIDCTASFNTEEVYKFLFKGYMFSVNDILTLKTQINTSIYIDNKNQTCDL